MSSQESKGTGGGKKLTSGALRERLGGVPRKNLEYAREITKVRKEVLAALREGPSTVPEIAEKSGIPPHLVLWHLMSLRKYGKIVEGGEEGGYFRYGLKNGGEEP